MSWLSNRSLQRRPPRRAAPRFVLACVFGLALGLCPSRSLVAESPASSPISPVQANNQADPTQAAIGRKSIVIAAVGDVILSAADQGILAPEEGRALFALVAPYLKARVVFANLEGVISDVGNTRKCAPSTTEAAALSEGDKARENGGNLANDEEPLEEEKRPADRCFVFRTPESYAPSLREAGLTLVSTANNHVYDYGQKAYDRMLGLLDTLGVAHSGETGSVGTQQLRDLRVALLAFTVYPRSNNLLDEASALALIRKTALAADILVVSMHIGAEGPEAAHITGEDERMFGEARGNPLRFAHRAIEAGADLILGHGPHVLRGLELYQGRLIAYSLGNFLTYAPINVSDRSGVAGILRVRLAPDGHFLEGEFVPTKQRFRHPPTLDAERSAWSYLNELARDFNDRGVHVDAEGQLVPPPSFRTEAAAAAPQALSASR